MRAISLSWSVIAVGALLAAACSADRVDSPTEAGRLPDEAVLSGGWNQLVSKGSGPANINAAAYAPNLQVIFAAEMPDDAPGHLWRFDLRHNQWTELTVSNWPIGKYRNLIYDIHGRRLLTYWNGVGQVYAIPDAGGSWVPDGSAPNQDDSYESYAFFNPVRQRLTVFAGYGFGVWNDVLREWNPGRNQWKPLAQSSPHPEPRFGHGASTVALDQIGRRAFLGQRSLGAAAGKYDDLWELDLRGNQWHNLIPPFTSSLAQVGSAFAWAAKLNRLFRFGGCGPIDGAVDCTSYSNDLLITNPDASLVHWRQIPKAGSAPAPRVLSGFFYDTPRNRLILISGNDGTGWLDDVWEFRIK